MTAQNRSLYNYTHSIVVILLYRCPKLMIFFFFCPVGSSENVTVSFHFSFWSVHNIILYNIITRAIARLMFSWCLLSSNRFNKVVLLRETMTGSPVAYVFMYVYIIYIRIYYNNSCIMRVHIAHVPINPLKTVCTATDDTTGVRYFIYYINVWCT